jgi:hypothetical protein
MIPLVVLSVSCASGTFLGGGGGGGGVPGASCMPPIFFLGGFANFSDFLN